MGLGELIGRWPVLRQLGSDGFLAEPYRMGKAGLHARLSTGLTAGGALVMAAGRTRAGGALLCAGAACRRLSVFDAGFQSARDPKYTVVPQRRRLENAAKTK